MDYHEMEMRAVYARTLNDLMDENPHVVCLEADLGKSSGTVPEVREKHPDNFIECGVCEANMIGVAAGLAKEGKIPFCASFTSFASRRAYDQVTISVGFANNNVKIVGTAPGITNGPNGGTHICFQDLAIMRAMPNMHVYSPCDVYDHDHDYVEEGRPRDPSPLGALGVLGGESSALLTRLRRRTG